LLCGWRSAEDASKDCGDVKGRVAIITGPTAGIGLVTAKVMASKGIHVILAGRNKARLKTAEKTIRSQFPNALLTSMELDLGSLRSVRKFASDFLQLKLPLHYLINNAGIMGIPSYTLSDDGFEVQFGTNHLGHFLLTQLLIDSMKAASPTLARIVNVSSTGHIFSVVKSSSNVENFNLEKKNYNPWSAYGNSKLGNVLLALELSKRLKGTNIMAFSLHPGAIPTELGRSNILAYAFYCLGGRLFMKTVNQGAATTLYCAFTPGLERFSGAYFDNCKLGKTSEAGRNSQLAEALWDFSAKLVSAQKKE